MVDDGCRGNLQYFRTNISYTFRTRLTIYCGAYSFGSVLRTCEFNRNPASPETVKTRVKTEITWQCTIMVRTAYGKYVYMVSETGTAAALRASQHLP